jgi:hypothetical protein
LLNRQEYVKQYAEYVKEYAEYARCYAEYVGYALKYAEYAWKKVKLYAEYDTKYGKNMQNSDRSTFCIIFDIYMQNMPKNMQNNMQNMQKIYIKKHANLFGICRIVTGSYSAY